MSQRPKAFISYSWDSDEHCKWVKDLAARLRRDGVDVTLDQWETAPGDQLPEFMERAVRKNDYILIVCTPRYKERSDNRRGGVGYEGDIMTGSALSDRNAKQFIPLLREGNKDDAIPTWLQGRFYLDFRMSDNDGEHYHDLLTTLHDAREKAPPIGRKPPPREPEQTILSALADQDLERDVPEGEIAFEPVNIEGVIVDEVSKPRHDGTRGSALYKIPFKLSRRPTREWADVFVTHWNRPPRFTTMHRPGIAQVFGDKIILDGTTIEEVEQYHRDTLALAVEKANEEIAGRREKERRSWEEERRREEEHWENVKDVSDRLNFD